MIHEQSRKWLKILDGWGSQIDSKRFRCPYCHKTFLSVAGAQGHWATKHKRHGKKKPVYDTKKVVKRTVGKKVQLKNAQQKAAKNVKKKIHRSVEDCEKEIAAYEEALEEMTAEDYKKRQEYRNE